jgi:hypothetical protein
MARPDDQPPRAAGFIDRGMDFRSPPPTGPPNRLLLRPPFPPAADRCALTGVASSNSAGGGPPAPARRVNTPAQTPLRAQRTKRLYRGRTTATRLQHLHDPREHPPDGPPRHPARGRRQQRLEPGTLGGEQPELIAQRLFPPRQREQHTLLAKKTPFMSPDPRAPSPAAARCAVRSKFSPDLGYPWDQRHA